MLRLNNGTLQYFWNYPEEDCNVLHIIRLHHNDSDLASTKLNGKSKSFFFASGGAKKFILKFINYTAKNV